MTDADPKDPNRGHKIAIVVIIAISLCFAAVVYTNSSTTIQTTIIGKWTDASNGIPFFVVGVDGGVLTLPVNEKTYQALEVGDCVIVTKNTIWGVITASYSIKGGCP